VQQHSQKNIEAILCQAVAIYNCKDKNQIAMISQRMERLPSRVQNRQRLVVDILHIPVYELDLKIVTLQ